MPPIPIQFRRRIIDSKRTSLLVFAEYHFNRLQFANPPLPHHFDSQPKSLVIALPRSDLNDLPCFLHNVTNQFAFINRERQRFLAVHILASSTGVNQHLRVPMVGSTDGDDIYVVVREQLLIVLVNSRCATKGGTSLFADMPVNVAQRHNVTVRLPLWAITEP